MRTTRILTASVATATIAIVSDCGEATNLDADPSAGSVAPAEIVDIWTPAASGDVATLAARLAQADDIDAPDPTFRATALMFAADFGQVAAVTLLLEHGADPNARGGSRSTPAIGAAFFGRPECLRILLESGADPSLADENGTTTYTALDVPWEITKSIGDLLRLPLEPEVLERGRDACRKILADA